MRYFHHVTLVFALSASLLPLVICPAAAAEPPCRSVKGLSPLLASASILLLGEMHGSEQAPAFTADAICWALASALPVKVGLEIPKGEIQSIRHYLASKGTPADQNALVVSSFWTRDYQDGRSSQAMAELIEEIRRLRASGADVDVFLFDSEDFAQNRDEEMAKRLHQGIANDKDSQWIILTGNIHSRVVPGVPWDKEFKTMGSYLKRDLKHHKMTALNMSYSGGSTWVCRGSEAQDCGPRELRGKADPGDEWTVSLDAGRLEKDGHNGMYSVGSLSASAPAKDR